MNIRSVAIAVAVFLTGCANDILPSSPASSGEKPPLVNLYQRGDGRESVRCVRAPDRDVCASNDQLGHLYSDCSIAEFDCVFDSYNVFAVPKQGLVQGQEYEVFGARLKVERCFGDSNGCSVAMISSACASDATCSCRLAKIGRTRAIFYYSSDLGITAFYTTFSEGPMDQAQTAIHAKLHDAIPLRTYVLMTGPGFLREHWNIRPARFKTQCSSTEGG